MGFRALPLALCRPLSRNQGVRIRDSRKFFFGGIWLCCHYVMNFCYLEEGRFRQAGGEIILGVWGQGLLK
jgi:hypothetical protein